MSYRCKYIALLIAISLLGACSSDRESSLVEPLPINLIATIENAYLSGTRAATNLYSAFLGGERIDVSIYNGSTVDPTKIIGKENIVYTMTIDNSIAKMSPPDDMQPYFPTTELGAITVRACYPSNPTEGTVSVTVLHDQISDINYNAGELLWSETTHNRTVTTDPVPLIFHHRMAKIIVNLTSHDGSPDLPGTITLKGFLPTATLTKSDGSVSASGDPIDIIMSANGAAMVPPQTKIANTALFELATAQGDVVTYMPPTDLVFNADYVYTYNVQVDMRQVRVSTIISTWGENIETVKNGEFVIVPGTGPSDL